MSDKAASDAPPQTPEALTAEIERTRQELGETVEALVAKTDVKARVRHRAAEVAGNLRGKARDAKAKAAGHAPSIPSAGGDRAYGVAAAALTVALIAAWLAVRTWRGSR